MLQTKIAGFCGLLLTLSHGLGVPFCNPDDPQRSRTLCDTGFCVCSDPYGRVSCRCPPETQVEDVVIRSEGLCAIPQETTSLTIESCENVTVVREAFANLKEIRSVTFENVRELTLESAAFRWRGHGLSVNISNVTVVPDVPSYAFAGRIDSVSFDGCYIGMIRAFAFSSIESADSITIRGSNVANVESQAFKKFPVRRFLIIDSQFNQIPSRFVFDVDVEDLFKLSGAFVNVIRTSGFKVNNPRVTVISDSRINTLHSEALSVRATGDVVFQNNRFNTIDREAFRGITVRRDVIVHGGKPKFKFLNNSVANFEERSFFFNRTAFDPFFSRVFIDEPCTCDGLTLWRDMIHGRRTEPSVEDGVEPFWCRVDGGSYEPGRDFYQTHCNTLTNSILFFVVIITGTSIALVLVIVIIVCVVQRRRKKWDPVPGTEASEKVKTKPAKAIIVPDGRTYRETEFHVIVEKAEPFDAAYAPCKVVRDRSRSQINSK